MKDEWFEVWWPRVKMVWSTLRGPAHSRLARVVVLAGLATSIYNFWQPYAKAAANYLVGEAIAAKVPDQGDISPWVGVVFVTLGLAYHLAATRIVALGQTVAESVRYRAFLDYLRGAWPEVGPTLTTRLVAAENHVWSLLPELALRNQGKVDGLTPISFDLKHYPAPSDEFMKNVGGDPEVSKNLRNFEQHIEELDIATRQFNRLTYCRTQTFMIFLDPTMVALTGGNKEDWKEFVALYKGYCGEPDVNSTLGDMLDNLKGKAAYKKDLEESLSSAKSAAERLQIDIKSLKTAIDFYDRAFSAR